MKRILVAIFLLASCYSFGQTPPGYTGIGARYKWIAGGFDSTLVVPRYNGAPSGLRSLWNTDGQVALDTVNSRFYIYSGGVWNRVANYSEIGGMDTAYSRNDSLLYKKNGVEYFVKKLQPYGTIAGLLSAGTNVTVTGSGTTGSPYVISSSGGGGSVTGVKSVEIVGDSAFLKNDSQTPGNYKVYGTNGSGTKGYQPTTVINTTGRSDNDYLQWKDSCSCYINVSSSSIGSAFFQLRARVGVTTNFPEDGEFEYQDSSFIGKRVTLIREGIEQDSSDIDGYTFNASTGEFTFDPPLSDSERIIIRGWASIIDITPATPPGGGAVDITFPTQDVPLTNTAGVWTVTSGTGGYGGNGLSTLKLPSGVDGYIYMRHVTGTGDAILGFNTANATTGYSGVEAGIYISSNAVTKVDGGSAGGSIVGVTTGDLIRLHRVGSTLTIELSTDSGATWGSAIYTYTFSSSADLYIVCDINGSSGTLNNPKGVGVL